VRLSRRDFLKVSGASTAGVVLAGNLPQVVAAAPAAKAIPLRKKRVKEVVTICTFCAGGCGALVQAEDDKVINIEGDPDHVINEGAMCPKFAALSQMRTVDGALNKQRLTKVLYRAPGASEWEEKSWEWAFDEITKKVKKTRDNSFITKDADGITVNRTEAIAGIGNVALVNEECYALGKLYRALGMVYLDNQARL